LLGRGLVEPVDDLRPTNPPTHPALLDALAGDFAASGFDIRALIRMIVSSKTYQRSSRTLEGNRNDSLLYSHAYLKELAAPVFADAVARATGVPDAFPGYSPGTRAVQLATPAVPSPALDLLGRCQRVATCDRPAQSGGGVARTLHLINGSTVNAKLKGGVLTELFDFSSGNLVEELYCRTLSRMPTPDESTEWSAFLDTTPDPTAAAEDLLWTLLNSREFGFNH
jgi:hypothetical protein